MMSFTIFTFLKLWAFPQKVPQKHSHQKSEFPWVQFNGFPILIEVKKPSKWEARQHRTPRLGRRTQITNLRGSEGMPLLAGVKAGKGTVCTPAPASPAAQKGTIGLITDPAVARQFSLLLTHLSKILSIHNSRNS